MKKYAYILEQRDVQYNGLMSFPHLEELFTSVKQAEKFIKQAILMNKAFNVLNIDPLEIAFDINAIRVISYKWNTAEQGCNNIGPNKVITSYFIIRKLRY